MYKKKNIVKIMIFVTLCAVTAVLFIACGKTEDAGIKTIEIVGAESIAYSNGEFDFSNAGLKVVKTDGSSETVGITESMLELPSSMTEGFNVITIVHEGYKTQIAVNIVTVKGEAGKSAYELYLDANEDYNRTEAQWHDDYVNGRLAALSKINAIAANYSSDSYTGSNWAALTGYIASAKNDIYGLDFRGIFDYDFSALEKSINSVISGMGYADSPYVVSTKAALESVIAEQGGDNVHIRLGDDIYNTGDYSAITFRSNKNELNFTIDLNGHTLGMGLYFYADDSNEKANGRYKPYDYDIDVIITDSSIAQTGQIGTYDPSCLYGILLYGASNLTLDISNITVLGYYFAMQSYGTSAGGGNITAANCSFIGTNPDADTYAGVSAGSFDSFGVYLATNHYYTFNSCAFEGGNGYYAKSGTHILNNCSFAGKGAYNQPKANSGGAYSTGSAVMIDSHSSYVPHLDVIFNGGTFTSESGYAIQEVTTGGSNYCGNLALTEVDPAGIQVSYVTDNFYWFYTVTASDELGAALQSLVTDIYINDGAYELISTASGGVTDVWNSKALVGESEDGVIINITGAAASSQASIIFRNDVVLKNLTINAENTDDVSAVKISTIVPGAFVSNAEFENVTITGAKGLNIHGVENMTLDNVTVNVASAKECVAVSVAWSNVEINNSAIGNGTWGSLGVMYAHDSDNYGEVNLTIDDATTFSSWVYVEESNYGYCAVLWSGTVYRI